MTEIAFLGTGGDTYVISRGIRQSGCIVIKHNNMQLVIDPGVGTLQSARRCDISLRATTAVICTSSQLHYANDLNAVITSMTYDGSDITGVVVGTPKTVEQSEHVVPWLRKPFSEYIERVMVALPDKKIGIEDADIYFNPIIGDEDAVGMKIVLPDVTIGYTPDTGYAERIATLYEGCDILILSVPLAAGMQSKSMLSSVDAIKFIQRVKPKLAILTRFGKSMLENDPLQEARQIHSETGVQVLAASDGQIISPSSYSAKGSQQRLKKYQ